MWGQILELLTRLFDRSQVVKASAPPITELDLLRALGCDE